MSLRRDPAPARRKPPREGEPTPPFGLLAGSVLIRWLEWSFVGALAAGRARSPRAVLLGRSGREHLWRVGGVVLSFATDVAGLLGAGALGLIPC